MYGKFNTHIPPRYLFHSFNLKNILMKTVYFTWWICAIIGAVLILTLTDNSANNNAGFLLILGLIGGAFCGLIIGLVIDKIKEGMEPSQASKLEIEAEKENPMSNERESNFTGISAQYASGLAKIINGDGSMKSVLIKEFYHNMDMSISKYRSANSEALRDPILGPMKLINFINVSSDELKKSLLSQRDVFGLNEDDITDIIRKVHSYAMEKNFQ